MDDAMRKWETTISTKEEGLQETYRDYLQKFLERWYLTPEELIELRNQNLRSDDSQDRRLIEDMVKTQMTEMIESCESPYNCPHI